MSDIHFRVWHRREKRMYYRGYQKLLHVLLCDEDGGKNEGKGRPVKRASHEDCEFLQGTGVLDERGKEVFEGDYVRIRCEGKEIEGVLHGVPDMYKSRRLHPLHELLEGGGISGKTAKLELSVHILGNRYEGYAR